MLAVETPDITFSGDPLVLDTVRSSAPLSRSGGTVCRPICSLRAFTNVSPAASRTRACTSARNSDAQRVALSGGVFQNALLLSRVEQLLRERELVVYTNHQVPANDGGISLGQALIAGSQSEAVPEDREGPDSPRGAMT